MARAKKIKAEEEIKEVEKDLEKVEEAPKAEETTKVEDTEIEESAKESENLIVLDSGATVDEQPKMSEEEVEDLVKITKVDGTEIFVEKVEGEDEEKKEIYEAIVEAEKPEVAEELEDEVNEEIDAVSYIPAACHTAHASLNNSYYVLKLKSGKIKALKAGKILNKTLKASILNAIKEGKKLPTQETIFNKIASKIGNTFGAFSKLASKMTKTTMKTTKKIAERMLPTVGDTVELAGKEIKIVASKNGIITLKNGKKLLAKQLKAAELPEQNGKKNEDAEMLKNFAIDEQDIEKSKMDSEIALESKELNKAMPEDVKSSTSKVKSLFNRLPFKSGVGDEVEWAMKDFNKERNPRNKTLAAQIKSLRDATKELRAQKEIVASKDAEIEALKKQLASINAKEEVMIKSAKINKILASMNIEDAEEKAAMTQKFASYSKDQLDAIYETMTACPSEEATIMHERMINEEMKKEASELKGFVPSFNLEEEVSASASDDMERLVLEKEMSFQNKNYRGN